MCNTKSLEYPFQPELDPLFRVKVSAEVCIWPEVFVPQRLVVTMGKRSAPWDITEVTLTLDTCCQGFGST